MATFGNFWQQMVTFGNKWQTLATNGDFSIFAFFGKTWKILAIIVLILLQSVTVSGSVLQSVTVHGSSVVVRAVCVSLLQSLAVCGNYDNLWQSMAVSGSHC